MTMDDLAKALDEVITHRLDLLTDSDWFDELVEKKVQIRIAKTLIAKEMVENDRHYDPSCCDDPACECQPNSARNPDEHLCPSTCSLCEDSDLSGRSLNAWANNQEGDDGSGD